MPKGFTDREKDLIRERLLEAGDRLFSAHGLKKTNVAELAAAARISKGAFYLFYPSKEALFMDVAERAEARFRQAILAALARPGPTPRARLLAAFQEAFALLRTIPLLQFLTSSDYELLFRRVPAATLQAHLASDRAFFAELIAHARRAGIPIRVRPEAVIRLLYPLVLSVLHGDELGESDLGGGTDALLELVAAYCLGEVALAGRAPGRRRAERRRTT